MRKLLPAKAMQSRFLLEEVQSGISPGELGLVARYGYGARREPVHGMRRHRQAGMPPHQADMLGRQERTDQSGYPLQKASQGGTQDLGEMEEMDESSRGSPRDASDATDPRDAIRRLRAHTSPEAIVMQVGKRSK